jgi:hypothetical protein
MQQCLSFTHLFIPYSSPPASRDLICMRTFWITKKCTHTEYFKHTFHIMKEYYVPKNPSPFKTTNLFWKSDRLFFVLTNSMEHNPSFPLHKLVFAEIFMEFHCRFHHTPALVIFSQLSPVHTLRFKTFKINMLPSLLLLIFPSKTIFFTFSHQASINISLQFVLIALTISSPSISAFLW